MKHTVLILMAPSLIAFAMSCTSTGANSTTGSQTSETTAVKRDEAKTQIIEAVQATKNYTYAQKDEYIDTTKAQLDEIQAELDRLSAKVDNTSGAIKADAKIKLAAVHEKWITTKQRLEQAQNATESSWDELQNEFSQSYGELKDSFADARQWFSDKIEPQTTLQH